MADFDFCFDCTWFIYISPYEGCGKKALKSYLLTTRYNMMEPDDFKLLYKTFSNSELLEIVENPDSYQTLAVEAARHEFLNRGLSEEEVQEVKTAMNDDHLQKEKEREKLKIIGGNIKRTGFALLETLNPIEQKAKKLDMMLRLIIIVFSIIFLFQLYREYKNIMYSIQDLFRFPISGFLGLFPVFILPIALIGFWKRKSWGWIFLVIYLVYSLLVALWILGLTWRLYFKYANENFFRKPPIAVYLFSAFFLAGTLIIICKQNMREVFTINKDIMTKSIIMTAILTLILLIFS